MRFQKTYFILLFSIPALMIFGCRAPFQFSIPMNPSVSALSVESKNDQGRQALNREKIFITDRQCIRDILAILEKYKDESKLRTFDFDSKYDICISWQIRETGIADNSRVYLTLKEPQQIIYSIEREDQSRLTYVVTISKEDAKTLRTLLGIKTSQAPPFKAE